MNILIRFEDNYGCSTLFNYSTSALLTCSGLETVSGLGNAGVFNVSKRVSDYYDFIILVFDLDSPSTGSLTSKELLRFC